MRWLLSCSLLLLPAALLAQEKAPAVPLRLHPAAISSPALKHLLLPDVRDLRPGNAAVYYQRAHSPDWFRPLTQTTWYLKMHDWLELPLAKVPRKELGEVLEHHSVLKELELAARCEHCDWQMSQRIRDEGVALLLPDVQGFRQFAQLLALKARAELQQGNPEAALRTLQTGLAMSRHVGDCPIVINWLVGVATANLMVNVVEDVVQQPGAPNLYWALRDLPEPFLDLRRPLQGDRLAVEAVFPEIRKALNEPKFQPLSLATLRGMVDRTWLFGGNPRSTFAMHATLVHPKAKAFFVKQGRSEEELEALPVTQLVLMYGLAQWDHYFDAVYRWHNVPYWQARAGIKKATEERKQAFRDHPEAMVLGQHFLPANEAVFLVKARLDRRLAALQVVEAIRLHATANQGHLPESLDDLRDVPLPLDPVTGRGFEYALGEGSARLYAPPPPGEVESERNVLHYRITIVPRKK
jgi:hypothetical protein